MVMIRSDTIRKHWRELAVGASQGAWLGHLAWEFFRGAVDAGRMLFALQLDGPVAERYTVVRQ